jgi:hypothetical protein
MPLDSIEAILRKGILESDEFKSALDESVKRYTAMVFEKRLTRDDMAKMYQISTDSVDKLSDENLSQLGWRKIKVGARVLFERIEIVEISREMFKRVKKA